MTPPKLTHYVPMYSSRAICGMYFDGRNHSAEPSCAECAAELKRQDEEDERTAESLHREFPDVDPRTR